MPSGNVEAERVAAAAAQEYPDRTGWTPDNPYLAVFRPFIPTGAHLRELTPLPLIMGTLLGIVFGASSLYLVLKVGLTVSASIPVAVISITLFRTLSKIKAIPATGRYVLTFLSLLLGAGAFYLLQRFGISFTWNVVASASIVAVLAWVFLVGARDATILENNIVQTAGSAGESIAFGLGVTMPAIMILGFDLEFTRVMLVAVLGGLLGILMMIPLRRALIVQQHGYLKYPEGTACAEVLKAGASAESLDAAHTDEASARVADEATTGGKVIFAGFGIGFVYYALEQILKTWKEVPTKVFGKPFEGGSLSLENNPALLGVGYIIGPRISSIMVGGGVLSYLVLIPAIKYFGSGLGAPLAPETAHTIADMTVGQIQKAYILYIGAGAVAAGGIISLFRSLPIIWHGLKGGISDLRGTKAAGENAPRVDRDLSMKWVLGGIIALLIVIMIAPQLNLRFNLLGALLIVAFGFLFVTVSSRLTGEVGSSSNPISGMTVATLLLTCLVFLIIGWTAPPFFVTALSIGGIVCIASSNGGTTSQDLKTGFLVGSTPKYQQIAILVGALASALVLGPILLQLNQAGTVYVPVTGNKDFAFPSDYHAAASDYEKDSSGQPKRERLSGAQAGDDNAEYFVYHKTTPENGPAGRYLVNQDGVPVYLADPGINGIYDKRPDGSSVQKFTAPKATLMSYIIKGILSGKLPWGLVLLGVFIAIVLELSGIPSLAFAVGVYLPLSTSSPIFVGGMIRLLVDKYTRRKYANARMSEEQLVAEGDKSNGVLLSSGYIAGGTLAGVIFAFMNIPLKDKLDQFEKWATANNPFFEGPWSDVLAMIPFILLTVLLYVAGREWWLSGRRRPDSLTRDLK
ncbi:MAG: oligopeptide transporter, OPT family [Acidobacteria bacterium]|nr:MAG: oligopeptide transporter, OPT family [Acidobacteriota bacterium]